MVISGKSAFFWGVESIRLSCRRGRCFAAGPVGCQGSAYLYFFSQMRTICQDTGGFARSPHFHLFNKQALFQGWGLLCVSFLGQDSVYVLTALPTELHRPRADDGIRTHDKLIYIMRLLLEPLRGVGHPAAFAARVGLRVGGDGADEIKTPLCRTYVPVVRAYGTNTLGFLTSAVAGCVFCSPTVGTRLALVFRKPVVAHRQPVCMRQAVRGESPDCCRSL